MAERPSLAPIQLPLYHRRTHLFSRLDRCFSWSSHHSSSYVFLLFGIQPNKKNPLSSDESSLFSILLGDVSSWMSMFLSNYHMDEWFATVHSLLTVQSDLFIIASDNIRQVLWPSKIFRWSSIYPNRVRQGHRDTCEPPLATKSRLASDYRLTKMIYGPGRFCWQEMRAGVVSPFDRSCGILFVVVLGGFVALCLIIPIWPFHSRLLGLPTVSSFHTKVRHANPVTSSST